MQKVRQDVNASNISFIGQQSNGPGYAEVHSSVLLKDRPTPVKVDYLLRQDGAQWRFYDLNIDAISVMANYRNQFNRVINNQGFDTLLADLKRKQQGLEDQLGTSHSHD